MMVALMVSNLVDMMELNWVESLVVVTDHMMVAATVTY